MSCAAPRELVQAHLDRELDLVRSLEMEEHLRECSTCAGVYRSGLRLRAEIGAAELVCEAPPALRARVRKAVAKESPREPWSWLSSWRLPSLAASFALAVVALALVPAWLTSQGRDALVDEIVSSHVRSLMVEHLTDVPSSDKHTVKPWFDGKLDFAPPVVDLADQGFPLAGGRLDVLRGRPVAALVYRRAKHFINLFVSPVESAAVPARTIPRHGFNVVLWSSGGMTFSAVSDLNAAELGEFADLVRERAASPPA